MLSFVGCGEVVVRLEDIERRIERWIEDMEDRQQCELFIIVFQNLEYMGIFSIVSSMFRYLKSWVKRKY